MSHVARGATLCLTWRGEPRCVSRGEGSHAVSHVARGATLCLTGRDETRCVSRGEVRHVVSHWARCYVVSNCTK